jgi:hypothetical protein
VTVILRRRLRDVYLIAERKSDGTWTIDISDALSGPVGDEEKKEILESVMEELMSLASKIDKELKS